MGDNEMFTSEDVLNQTASFLPMSGSYLDDDSDGTLPCLVVGGVQVYAYFKGGVLRVTIDSETAAPEVDR